MTLALVLVSATTRASHITVSVAKTAVESDDATLTYVRFADEPILVNVSLNVYALPDRPSSEKGLRELMI